MAALLVDEQDLARLSPSARQELLGLFGRSDTASDRDLPGQVWDADGDEAYPLSLREAKELIRGLSSSSRAILRVFCASSGDAIGRATLTELLTVSGHSDVHRLRKAIPGITRRLRTVTRNKEAWIFDWLDEDWVWDDEKKTYLHGAYFIPSPAIQSLRQAFGPEAAR